MKIVDQVVVDMFLIMFSVTLTVLSIICGIWVLDRSRRNTPAYALGRSMQDSWASVQARRIRSGQAAPMPSSAGEVEDLALLSMSTKGFSPEELERLEKAEELKKLKDQKKNLDTAAETLLKEE